MFFCGNSIVDSGLCVLVTTCEFGAHVAGIKADGVTDSAARAVSTLSE